MTTKLHIAGLFILILLCALIYSQGINGPFLYDDISNLSPLAQVSNSSYIEGAKHFIFGNHSGPLGRPVSMASFYLNSQTWPVDAKIFKITNIIIHLLCGYLIYLFIQKLIARIEPSIDIKNASFIALVTAGFWLFHPLHVSTTLYVVQRMTQLSTLFSLLTLIVFLHYQPLLQSSHRVRLFIWPSILIVLLIALAVLSKENAVLVFLALIVINAMSIKKNSSRVYTIWFYTLTVVPIVISFYHLYSISSYFATTYEYRGFTLNERLLTELRVIIDYLIQILLPNSNSMTIFHDDFVISQSLISPISTLFSLLLILSLLSLLFFKIRPVYKFSIAWFFLWHLLESTAVPLYLYFEHRNYLAALGPLLALSYGINHFFENRLSDKNNLKLIITATISVFFAFQLSMLSKLWSDEESLLMHWLSNHEKSKETLISLVQYYENNNNLPIAYAITIKATEYKHFQNDLGTQLKLYNQQCILNKNNRHTLNRLQQLATDPKAYSLSVLQMNASITLSILAGTCKPDDIEALLKVLRQIEKSAPQKVNPVWLRDLRSKLAFIYLYYNNLPEALSLFKKAYVGQPDLVIAIIDINIKLSNFTEAQEWLTVARRVNVRHKLTTLDKTTEIKILQSRLNANKKLSQ